MAINTGKSMSSESLEKYLTRFLSETNMCVLSTCSHGIPRATPLEYRSKGLTLYFVGEPGTKLKNIAVNPNVSVGIYFPYTGFESAKGVQITGRATVIPKGTKDFEEALVAYQWEKTAKEFNLSAFPDSLILIRVDPAKFELTDMSLKKIGYSARQTLLLGKVTH